MRLAAMTGDGGDGHAKEEDFTDYDIRKDNHEIRRRMEDEMGSGAQQVDKRDEALH